MSPATKYLYKYITRSSTISSKTNIDQQIAAWKRSNGDEAPEILIDLERFQDIFAQCDQVSILLGGRYQIYNTLFERFVKQLLSKKVKLKFFLAAHQTIDEPSVFIPHQETEYTQTLQLVDQLAEAANVKNLMRKEKYQNIPSTVKHNLTDVIRKFCSKDALHVCYYRHTQEIAQYASKHAGSVLAIISNNLELLLFDGAYEFWYANSINLRSLNVTKFCPRALETTLNLTTKQLQLHSVLNGSPYIPSDIIDNYFSKLDIQKSNQFEFLASYIKANTHDETFDLEAIAAELFEVRTDKDINAITNGLNRFDTTFSIKTTHQNDAFSEFSRERNPFIYKLMVEDVYLIEDISYLDYRTKRAQYYPGLVIPLIQKIMGVLFKNHIIKPMDRKICMKLAHDEPSRILRIPVSYPNLPLPATFVLIYKNREECHNSVRWSLLTWMFDLKKEFRDNLMKLPREFKTVALTLQYLLHQKAISIMEADAILYAEYDVRNTKDGEMPQNIPYPDTFDIDHIEIAHLYCKIFVLVSRSFEICGLNRHTDLLRFDGPIFYTTLDKFKEPSTSELSHLLGLSQIAKFRIYSTE